MYDLEWTMRNSELIIINCEWGINNYEWRMINVE